MCTDGAIVRVFSTSTGHVIYGSSPKTLGGKLCDHTSCDNYVLDDFEMYAYALCMIRHARWWQENTDQLIIIRGIKRFLRMK